MVTGSLSKREPTKGLCWRLKDQPENRFGDRMPKVRPVTPGGIVPMMIESIPCVAVMTFQGLLVTRLDAGHEDKTVAQYEWITDFVNNIATPAVFENYVLITSAYNHQAN